ncbi:hypothetical protein JXQ31_16395 [candidate division KSB1 bacterium]|nr:hypothetical protein [candidate division KSB1 bacterium]
MKKMIIIAGLLFFAFLVLQCGNQPSSTQNWTHFVRIGGHGLRLDRIDNIIESATSTHVFGIEVDNDIPGRYESFLNPDEKLQALRAVADKAHSVGNYAFVYIAGLECITARADQTEHTFFKDHPDWVQRDINGRPAVFGGGDAFWITEGDEDVWISPYPKEWRDIYMERVRQIAGTGIDGVYVDIPYWMTHFRGWNDTWASFDDYTVAVFKEKTGLNAKTDIKLGDFDDPNFRKWVDFRIEALTNFMQDIDKNVKSVNPNCMTIAEIYPGIEEAAVRVGADVYDMYRVVDVIAHEYSAGGYTAASRNPLAWFNYMVGMYSFRAFAETKASWMLSYSWDNVENIAPKDAMQNLALSQVMAGTNTWDARGHVMSGSNDFEARKEIFKWIGEHEKTFYLPRNPLNPIGVYFSDKTRNYFCDEFMDSYKGIMNMLLQSHLEFQIVTPRTLADFQGAGIILPDVKCIGAQEIDLLGKLYDAGKFIYATGETGKYDMERDPVQDNPVLKLAEIQDDKVSQHGDRFVSLPECPGKQYFQVAGKDFDQNAQTGQTEVAEFMTLLNAFQKDMEENFAFKPAVEIKASPYVSTQIALVDNKTHVFIANFKGLKGNENASQLPETDVKISFPAKQNARVFSLPYLGQVEELKGEWSDGQLTCVIPEIQKGMVVWCE